MGSHNPAPMKISKPKFPIQSILRAAEVWMASQECAESIALRDWAADAFLELMFDVDTLNKGDRLVLNTVLAMTTRAKKPVTTHAIETELLGKTDTGVRGSLSRLVKCDLLCRPERARYWPAFVAYEG